jgi:hypothetical protein
MATVGRTTNLPSIYPHSFSRYYRQHHRRISLLVTHSDSTRSHTACIEEETFLLVKKGIDFNSQYVFTPNSSGESRSNRPSSLSPHFLVLDLAVANASSALSSHPLSPPISVSVPLNYCSQRPYRLLSLFLHVSRHPSCPSCASPGTVADTNGQVSLGGCRL